MATVYVHRTPECVGHDFLIRLKSILPSLIAKWLTDEGGRHHVQARDIKIRVFDNGLYDVYRHNLEIKIFANTYPWRRDNLTARAAAIRKEIFSLLPTPGRGKPFPDDCSVMIHLGVVGYSDSERDVRLMENSSVSQT